MRAQILFLTGVTMTIGGRRTLNFFFKRKRNFKGTAFFFSGLALVLYGWALFGMLIESYGFVLLFRYRHPIVASNPLRAASHPASHVKSCLDRSADAPLLSPALPHSISQRFLPDGGDVLEEAAGGGPHPQHARREERRQ